MNFSDNAEIEVQAGNGGNGIVSFRREKFVEFGGPDGGDGGRGGDVIAVGRENIHGLSDYRSRVKVVAESGQSGNERKKHGRSGGDSYMYVPVGTQVFANDRLIADITEENQQLVIARGGDGGFGNAHFTSSTRQAPKVAERGEKGESLKLRLELKLIAEVGLVGLPNAGKSTLLGSVSNAKPKVADYAFTTLKPHIGVVDLASSGCLFVDIPGLIDGAAEGKGLGDEFLRHVERTSILLHCIDIYSDDIARDYKIIDKELASYDNGVLKNKPRIVALTKVEGLSPDDINSASKPLKKLCPYKIFPISAKSSEGLAELFAAIEIVRTQVDVTDEIPVIGIDGVVSEVPAENEWSVEVIDETNLRLQGVKIERFASRLDFNEYPMRQRMRDIMQKMGIISRLENDSVPLDTVLHIADQSIHLYEQTDGPELS